MKPRYTARQGQFLAFIHHYTTLHGRSPAEAEMVGFFRVTPPSVHQMILTLERHRLITRAPGEARSIRLTLPPEEIPPLQSASTPTGTPPCVQQQAGRNPTVTEAALLRLGKSQIEDFFVYNSRNFLDDSEFIPLLDMLIEPFVRAGLSALQVNELRCHVCELYHRCCQKTEPESTFRANMELMFNYLPAARRKHWQWPPA